MNRTLTRPGRFVRSRGRQRVQHTVGIIHDFLCYNKKVNLADLLKKSINPANLDMIRRVAVDSAELGFPIYLVGGSVRDLLLGRPIVDFDFTLEGYAGALGNALVR